MLAKIRDILVILVQGSEHDKNIRVNDCSLLWSFIILERAGVYDMSVVMTGVLQAKELSRPRIRATHSLYHPPPA
jgi:hypothetical protein